MKRAFLFFISLISIFKTASAQTLNFKTGDELTIKTNDNETLFPGLKRHSESTFLLKVLNTNNGTYKLRCNLLRFKLKESSSYYTTVINTDSIKHSELNSAAMLVQFILLQKNFTVVLDSNGAILNIEGYNQLVQQAIKNWSLTPQLQDWALNSTKVFLTTTFKRFFFELPQNKISVKKNWSKDETNYVIDRRQGNLIYISASSASKNFTGKYVLDAIKLIPVSTTVSQKDKNGKVLIAGNYSHIITKGKTSIAPVDTAWINMAMSMSYMSDKFKSSKGDGDSAKVLGYLSSHNQLFKNDAYYNNNRLNLLLSVTASSVGALYDSLLMVTPNHFLKGNAGALFNKSYSALQSNADSAYGVLRYYYKNRLFNDWVQSALAQHFIIPKNNSDTISKIRFKANRLTRENSYLLLEKLHNDKTLLIQQKTMALYLWVTAQKNANNAQALNIIANKFYKLDHNYMREGSGGRYGLLLYSIFNNAGDKKNAKLLLKKVIADLSLYQADTLNVNRFTDRNLLAHAYYLSYQDAFPTDSVKGIEYLTKAALYSPSSAKEKVYRSYFDKLFLDTKESYADDYIEKLFENGESDKALTVFAQYISSDLEHLAQAQAMFEKRFPNKSFKIFFADKVVSSWVTAPVFTLKGADDKSYDLANYKGKWLLTDFWGTWCGPCRQEMPKVNQFNNELIEGKLAVWAFLSIACKDNVVAVNKYLADNKYNIPVAMGDEKITHNYNIDGYPTKILISPTGKMISISTGSDWRAIITQINELYPAQ